MDGAPDVENTTVFCARIRPMIQRGLYLLCCAVLLCTTSQNQAVAQGTPLQPPASPAIQVYLTATGKADSAVILNPTELSATIDKHPAQVTSLRSAKDEKLLFALVIDTSASEDQDYEAIKKAAILLFQSLATDGNQGYIVLFNDTSLISKRPLQLEEARETINGAKFGGGTALYEAIQKTSTQILSRSRNPEFPRRAIILITDGNDNQSEIIFEKARKKT